MFYGVSTGTVKIWDEDEPLLSHEFGYSEDSVFEQYTGLTDKNGTLIYEGDIVKEHIEVGDDDIDGEYRYRVFWDEETLCWSLSPNYGIIHKDLWETNQSREVIGNIHEPPKDFRPEYF